MLQEKLTIRPRGHAARFIAVLVGLAALSGCLQSDGGGEKTIDGRPVAALAVNPRDARAGEEVRFDAAGSDDPGGKIVFYRFDFGDGESREVESDTPPNVTHRYGQGGDFVATLLVLDNGTAGTGAQAATASAPLSVDEPHGVPPQVLFTAANGPDASRYSLGFEARNGAEIAGVNLTMQNALLAGSSEYTVRVVGPDNESLAERTGTVAAGNETTIEFEADLAAAGDHVLEVSSRSGGIRFGGELVVEY